MHVGIFTMAEPVSPDIISDVKYVRGAKLRIPIQAIIGYFAMKAGFTHVQMVGTAYRVWETPEQIDKAILSARGRQDGTTFSVEDV